MPVLTPSYQRYLAKKQQEVDLETYERISKLELFNEKTFYKAFVKDLLSAQKEVVIHCPFISKFRSSFFKDTFIKLRQRNIPIFIFTRPLEEHEYFAKSEISCALREYEEYGATIIYLPGFIHQKMAVIDRKILWEGSLNILSQRQSREIMRRIDDETTSLKMLEFLGLNKMLVAEYKKLYEKMYQGLVISIREKNRKKALLIIICAASPAVVIVIIFAIHFLVLLLKSTVTIASLIGLLFN
ncbi:MAG: phospholipase D-like domain-containing protein [Patescibacteria group bacterium]